MEDMENRQIQEIQDDQPAQALANEESQPLEETGDQETKGRYYTDDQFNAIIKDRLARQKEKLTRDLTESINQEKQQLEADREAFKKDKARYQCSRFLHEKGLSEDYMDVFDTDDPEKFKESVQKILEISNRNISMPTASTEDHSNNADIGKAFTDYRHKPKQKYNINDIYK